MNYDVLEESRNAVASLEDNAWTNHKDEYIKTKGAIEEFNDRIDYEEYKLNITNNQEDIDSAQDELTRIIDEILQFNDDFNASLMTIDTDANLMEVKSEPIDTAAIDAFLSNVENN